MPTKTIYVKDSDLPLWGKVQNQFGENISSLVSDCLRKRVEYAESNAGRMSKIALTFWDSNDEPNITKTFRGRWLVGEGQSGERADDEGFDAGTEWSVALTAKGQLLVYTIHVNDRFEPSMNTYADVGELLQDDNIPSNVKATVAAELGGTYEVEMDI